VQRRGSTAAWVAGALRELNEILGAKARIDVSKPFTFNPLNRGFIESSWDARRHILKAFFGALRTVTVTVSSQARSSTAKTPEKAFSKRPASGNRETDPIQ